AENAAWRNLVPLVFGMSVETETTDHVKPNSRRVLRRRRTTPIIEAIDDNVLIAKGVGILREKLQHTVLLGKFAAQVTMEGDVT
ncbi:hypothetical protein, partial [Rhizobium sp.]|uniref:hypothetical protein n=1 Tax=Rhizobium sp. TaxID=391 RepID=UPI0028ACAFF7